MMAVSFSCEESGMVPPTPIDKEDETATVNSFSNIAKLSDRVIYEVNLRAFSSSGKLAGVTAGLDHIQSLGTNVIWLMPIYPIGQLKGVNSPYSVQDYQAVNTEFGDLNDLIALVNEAHSRDMAVILDWVANHTSWDHEWMQTPDWYVQDSDGNIIEPPGTGWTDVAELNFDNIDMQAEMIASMKYWIEEAGIDGFRCDAIDFVPDAFWSEAIASINSATDKELIWLGEGGKAENFTSGFEFNYAWDFYGKIKNIYSNSNSASGLFVTHEQEMSGLDANQSKLRYITNHDVYAWDETPEEVYTNEGSVGAFVATAFIGGVPLIYSGQEIGRPSLISFFGKDPIDWSQNPDILKQYQDLMAVRESVLEVLHGELIAYSDTDVIAFSRTNETSELLILVNTRATSKTFSLPTSLQNSSWENLLTDENIPLGNEISLDAFQYLILQKQ
ncbi:Glycosidase [Reichenbachiella faecimaris]|uniref:Glycosidase n=2 Tax=Reichenbachiella faecimaris TaxID=692418 RepID=A0A1W2GMR1_REIFA|nr:Glycosidase [Reichenbachiella faecimaris]